MHICICVCAPCQLRQRAAKTQAELTRLETALQTTLQAALQAAPASGSDAAAATAVGQQVRQGVTTHHLQLATGTSLCTEARYLVLTACLAASRCGRGYRPPW